MHFKKYLIALACFISLLATGGEPPFHGTIFLDPNIIVRRDPSAFESLEASGRGVRTMFDRRVNAWIKENAFLFTAKYDDGLSIEIQVNPEFEIVDKALNEARRYAPIIGQLPTSLRKDVKTVWIHKGVNPFGGGNNNLLIHTGQALRYMNDGILEETLVHEASHTSLDADHARSADWLKAQKDDETFISTYARDNPFREDIAESFLLYLALEHRRDRISDELATTIENTMPNRLAYFRSQELDLYPMLPKEPVAILDYQFDRETRLWKLTWKSSPGTRYEIVYSSDFMNWVPLDSVSASSGSSSQWQQSSAIDEHAFFLQVR